MPSITQRILGLMLGHTRGWCKGILGSAIMYHSRIHSWYLVLRDSRKMQARFSHDVLLQAWSQCPRQPSIYRPSSSSSWTGEGRVCVHHHLRVANTQFTSKADQRFFA